MIFYLPLFLLFLVVDLTRMFVDVTKTWNPISGCLHYCRYCWARRLVETKLKSTRKYREGFKPKFHRHELKRRFKPGDYVFVVDMGDMWGDFIPEEWIRAVLARVSMFPQTTFLMLTKNPERYFDFLDVMPRNVVLGATVETNRDDIYQAFHISRAPPPSRRMHAMEKLDWDRKFVSMEPVLEFDVDVVLNWLGKVQPEVLYVGYDNYGYRLPEPRLSKVLEFVSKARMITTVKTKTLREGNLIGEA